MTLVITEISEYGIVMVADGAVTKTNPRPGEHSVEDGVKKLQIIPYLNAGTSMWGGGSIGKLRTDRWIEKFIQEQSNLSTIDEFAVDLRDTLQRTLGRHQVAMGFHIAGFGDKLPTCYHVRNCDGGYETGYTIHDFIVDNTEPRRMVGSEYISIRNGDYGLYAHLSRAVDKAFTRVSTLQGQTFPKASLSGRVCRLKTLARLVSDIYHCSDLLRTIGDKIMAVGISQNGIEIQELNPPTDY